MTTARTRKTAAGTGRMPKILRRDRRRRSCSPASGGTTARPLLMTSDSPWNIEKVPSVTMIAGRRRPTASTPLTQAEQRAEVQMPPSAASHGLSPATISSAAITAEKLNIQPTERSISRIASRKTMPIASMPRKVVWPRTVRRLSGLRKRGRCDADHRHHDDERDDDADLVGQTEPSPGRLRPRRRRSLRPAGLRHPLPLPVIVFPDCPGRNRCPSARRPSRPC